MIFLLPNQKPGRRWSAWHLRRIDAVEVPADYVRCIHTVDGWRCRSVFPKNRKTIRCHAHDSERKRITQTIAERVISLPTPTYSVVGVSEVLGCDPRSASQALRALVNRGRLIARGRGLYERPA